MTFRGGLHAGASYYNAINATWPFAQLRIEKDSLAITSLIGNPKFLKVEIKKLSKYSGFFSNGIRIEHTANQPPFIVFWTFDLRGVTRCLEENGYSVQD